MKKSGTKPSLNSKLKYDEHGNIIVGSFSTQKPLYYNAFSCGSGYYKDKSERNRKGKAAQQLRNKLKNGCWDD